MKNINIQKINSENIYKDNFELTLDNLINEWPKKFTNYVHLERNKIRERKNDLKNQLILNSRKWISEIKHDINSDQEELKKTLFDILESYRKEKISKKDVIYLQQFLWITNVDWIFWPETFIKLVEAKKEIFIWNLNNSNRWNLPNLYDIIESIKVTNNYKKWLIKSIKNESRLDWWKEEFDNKYWLFTNQLWNQLGLPKNLINSIIYRETSFWKNLDNKWWSRWMMQLTSAPFYDMMWYHNWKVWVNEEREKTYSDIFWKIDIDKLKSIENIKNEIPEEIWQDLKWLSLNDFSDPKRYLKTIKKFKNLLKDKNWEYYHSLNIIIWSVYLKYLFDSDQWKWNEHQKIKRVSGKYNWNNQLINWRKTKDIYWDAVLKYWKKMWSV
jgi:hypothetical protein